MGCRPPTGTKGWRGAVARPVQRDTQWESARYGTGFGLMIGAHQKRPPGHLASVGSPQLPGVPFGLLPRLIYPTTPLTTPPCQRALVGHFLFSAKFICMGKQKNRLTATKPQNHFARIFPSRAQATQPRPASRMRLVPRAGDACSVRCAAPNGAVG